MEYYMNRCWLNKVCVSHGLNTVCVSRGLKAQQLPSPGQAKRRPGFGMRAMCSPCKGKSLCLLYTFAPSGRVFKIRKKLCTKKCVISTVISC